MNLKEVDKPEVKKTVVVYSGRFQPFHAGHYISYLKLCKKFGKDSVYIGTSNDTSGPKSPFNFNEKVKIMTKMFGVPSDKIVQVRNPYAPKEILSQFDGKTTQYIAAVGEKDTNRLSGKYFKPYNGKAGYGYDEIGYVYPVPAETNAISGTDVRNWLSNGDDEEKKKGFLKAYPKFDKGIFNMIKGKLNESANTEPSSALRPEPHPTRHEIEHPEDEKKAFDGNKAPYSPIDEIIEEFITEQMFNEFVQNYLGEAPNANLDQDISYTDTKGKPKKIKARSALRLPKDHPAHIQAAKLVSKDKSAKMVKGPVDAPANEPKKVVEPGKAAQQAAKPSVPGQPVKQGQTPQGKADKSTSGAPTGAEQPTHDPRQLKGAELKSDAEKTPKDKAKELAKQVAKKNLETLKSIIKDDFTKEEAHELHEVSNPHSATRKEWSERIGNFLKSAPANIIKGAYQVAKAKYHQLKNTSRGLQSLAVSLSQGEKPKFGMFKDRDGKWKHSESEAKRQKKACISTLTDVAVISASVVTGGAISSAIGHVVGGGGLSGIGHAITHGAIDVFHHGISGFAHHAAVDFAKHCGWESLFIGAGMGHSSAYINAAGAGLGHVATKAVGLTEGEDETTQHADMMSKMVMSVLEKMQDWKPSTEQMLDSAQSYLKSKQVSNLEKFTGPINENLSDSKEANIQNFVEYATKRLKLKEEPRIQFIEGEEYANAKSSLGGYDPMTKEIYVAVEGRLTADILRTLAHEMVHRKQDELGLIGDPIKAGADGSPVENQAHAVAGILMREYGRLNKEIYTEATLQEVSGLSGDDSQSDGAYLPKGRGRVLDGDDGVNKSDNWYRNGGYIQTEFPVADAIFGDDDENQVVVNYSAKNLKRTDDSIETDFPKREDKVEILPEDINIDVDKGDTILTGKFKNKKTTVKNIGTDDHGMPTINGKKATTFRIPRGNGQDVFDEVTTNDWHFKAIMKLYDKVSSFGKKKIGSVICKNPNASRRDIVVQLRDSDYEEVTNFTDKLGLNEYIEKKNKKYEELVNEYFTTLNEYFDALSIELPQLNEDDSMGGGGEGGGNFTDGVLDDQLFRSAYLPGWESFDTNGENYASIVGYTMIGHGSDTHTQKTGNVKIPVQNPRDENGEAHAAIHASKGEEYKKEKLDKWEMYPFNQRPQNNFQTPDVAVGAGSRSNIVKESNLDEKLNQSNLDSIERYADRELDPADIEFSNHFFDRVNDTRNGKEISEPELTGFFKRLGRHKKQFIDFLDKYNQIVVKDDRSNINIPFVKMANKVIAKTIMRKGNFQTSSPTIVNEITQGLYAGTLKIGGKPVEIEVELLGADNKTKEFLTKIIHIDKEYQHKLPIGSTFRIPARIFRLPGGGWHKIKSSAFKESLNEGGAYGHMSHPFDDMKLTFGDLKKIIKGALVGELELTREKTDGQALAISWKNGRLIAARNKGHLANAGANAMGIEDVASKFAGRGGLTDAYNFAMKDLTAAISSLSDGQRKKIFDEGKCFMNLEVIWPTSVNVIPYGQALLIFHNTTCYNEAGVAVGANQSAATMLAGMIKQVNADVQSQYTIKGPPVTQLPKNEELSSKQNKYITQLQRLQHQFQLSDRATVSEYHQAWWENFIDKDKPKLQKLEREALVRRWAFGDKSFRLNTIADKDAQMWAIKNDKVNVEKQQKENVRPFEELFLSVGADVLSFMGSVLTVNPDIAIRNMAGRLEATADKVRGSGDVSKLEKLEKELQRLQNIGGKDKIVPNEGIVFVYKGNTYKLTGTFAPLNQILGIFYE